MASYNGGNGVWYCFENQGFSDRHVKVLLLGLLRFLDASVTHYNKSACHGDEIFIKRFSSPLMPTFFTLFSKHDAKEKL